MTFGPILGHKFDVGRTNAGSFSSISDANALVNSVLQAYPDAVEAVRSGAIPSTQLYARFNSPTGYEAYRNDVRGPIRMRQTFGVAVRIRYEPRSPNGYVVVTSFPANHDPAVPRGGVSVGGLNIRTPW